MPSIQDSPYPLVFPVAAVPAAFDATPGDASDRLCLRTTAHALSGMQKEAVVCAGSSAWRMVCDEGPYLNGTDLAPFPLAFFCTGMVSSYLTELLALLKRHDIAFDNLRLLQDNRYAMEGSAVAGTMTGSALPVELRLEADSAAEPALLQQMLMEAVAASPVAALLRQPLVNTFTLTCNGIRIAPGRIVGASLPPPPEPQGFAGLRPPQDHPYATDIISKLLAATVREHVAGGAGTSLADNQKRVLHMRGICTLRADGLHETVVELYQPIGSRFRFVTDDHTGTGGARAPGSLAYLSAGLAFCYLTQIGRYAHIVKKPLQSYQLVQDTCFSHPTVVGGKRSAGSAEPVTTHVYLSGAASEDYARTVTDMSEQTCFLHAACRASVRVKLKEPLIKS
jgi:hypothetical protein